MSVSCTQSVAGPNASCAVLCIAKVTQQQHDRQHSAALEAPSSSAAEPACTMWGCTTSWILALLTPTA